MNPKHDAPEGGAKESFAYRLYGALNFIMAFYEPGQSHLDTNAWKNAEASARQLLAEGWPAQFDLAPTPPAPSGLVDASNRLLKVVDTYERALEKGMRAGGTLGDLLVLRPWLEALSGQQGGAVPAGDLPIWDVAEKADSLVSAFYRRFGIDIRRDDIRAWFAKCLAHIVANDDPQMTRDLEAGASHPVDRLAEQTAPAGTGADPATLYARRLTIPYTNWRGDFSRREIAPIRLFWGSNEWHPEPQWLIEAWDIGKAEIRAFALSGIGGTGADGAEGLRREVVAISGGLGAGKHSLASALTARTGAACVSFGAEIRRAVDEMGEDPTDLDKLQTIGQALVVNDCAGLIDRVLAQASGRETSPLIISGVRHVEVWCEMRRRFPRIRLVHVDMPEEARMSRLMARDGLERRLAARFDNAPSEMQISRILPQYASVRVDGTLPGDLQAEYVAGRLALRAALDGASGQEGRS